MECRGRRISARMPIEQARKLSNCKKLQVLQTCALRAVTELSRAELSGAVLESWCVLSVTLVRMVLPGVGEPRGAGGTAAVTQSPLIFK
jgi:hypothetical protein